MPQPMLPMPLPPAACPGGPSRRAVLLPLAGLLVTPAARAQALVLRTTGQEANTLKFDPTNTAAPGFSVEVMRWIEKRDPGLRFTGQDVLRPIKRIELELDGGGLEVFFGLVRTPAREARFNLLDVLYTQSGQLAALATDAVSVQSFDDLRALGDKAVIGVPKGSAYVDTLRAQPGLVVDDGVASVSATLRKLVSGRLRFVFFSGPVLRKYIRDEGLESQVRLLPARLSVQEVCAATARDLDPAKLRRLRAALEQLRSSGELRRLQDKYQVGP